MDLTLPVCCISKMLGINIDVDFPVTCMWGLHRCCTACMQGFYNDNDFTLHACVISKIFGNNINTYLPVYMGSPQVLYCVYVRVL